MLRRGNTFYISTTLGSSTAEKVFTYGRPGDQVVIGDWDGNRTDTIGIFRP